MGAESVFGEVSTVQVTVLETCGLLACGVFAASCAPTGGVSATVTAAIVTTSIAKLSRVPGWRILTSKMSSTEFCLVVPYVSIALEICNVQETGVFGILTMHVGKMGVISETTLGESARNFSAKLVLNRSWGARLRVSFAGQIDCEGNHE